MLTEDDHHFLQKITNKANEDVGPKYYGLFWVFIFVIFSISWSLIAYMLNIQQHIYSGILLIGIALIILLIAQLTRLYDRNMVLLIGSVDFLRRKFLQSLESTQEE